MYHGLNPQDNPEEYDKALSDFFTSPEDYTSEDEDLVLPISSKGQGQNSVKILMTPPRMLFVPTKPADEEETKICDAKSDPKEPPISENDEDFVSPPLLPMSDENEVARFLDDETMTKYIASPPASKMVCNVEEMEKNNAAYEPDVSEIPAFQPGNEMPSRRERRIQERKEAAKKKFEEKLARKGKKKKLTKRKKKVAKEGSTKDPEEGSDDKIIDQAQPLL